jgi:hypothetical protein
MDSAPFDPVDSLFDLFSHSISSLARGCLCGGCRRSTFFSFSDPASYKTI